MKQIVILLGHVGKDPEVRRLNDGTAVASFTLATNESYKDRSGQKVEETTWHNIVVWRNVAEIAEKYVKKGDLLYLEGKLKNRSWDDKDGKKPFGEKKPFGDKKPYDKDGKKPFGDKKSFGDKKPYAGKKEYQDRKPADAPASPKRPPRRIDVKSFKSPKESE